VPKLLITYKVISTVSYVVTLGLCYKYRPFKIFLKSSYGLKFNSFVISKAPKFYNNVILYRTKLLEKYETSTYAKKIPETIGLKSKRFGKAFMENFIFYKLTLPISIPFYMYLAIVFNKN